jgi:diguanylate cyclase (GGDEF)-like protein
VLTSPLDVGLAVALACLPLLLGIWLLVFGRTLVEARRAREAQLRLALAGDLGLRPRELTSLNTKALFKLREQAAFDDLTGALRRGAGISAIDREVARARRHKSPLSLAFVDIDGLKAANDRRGHAAGDKLIRGLAQALKDGLRDQDLLVRYGGDEFVCVLPDTPGDAGFAKLSAIQKTAAKAGVRFSVGLAELERSDDVVSVLARADRQLYMAKARRGEIVQLPPGEPGSGGRRITA